MCCLQEVGWRGKGSWMPQMKGRRCRLWWYGKGGRVGGVGAMVKDELSEVTSVGMVSNRVMAAMLALENDMLRLICGYAL